MRKENVTLLRAVRQRAEKIRAGSGSPKADAQRALGEATKKRKKLIPYAGKEHGAREDLMGNKAGYSKKGKKS
jgi:hypothetical protein